MQGARAPLDQSLRRKARPTKRTEVYAEGRLTNPNRIRCRAIGCSRPGFGVGRVRRVVADKRRTADALAETLERGEHRRLPRNGSRSPQLASPCVANYIYRALAASGRLDEQAKSAVI